MAAFVAGVKWLARLARCMDGIANDCAADVAQFNGRIEVVVSNVEEANNDGVWQAHIARDVLREGADDVGPPRQRNL